MNSVGGRKKARDWKGESRLGVRRGVTKGVTDRSQAKRWVRGGHRRLSQRGRFIVRYASLIQAVGLELGQGIPLP